MTLHTPISPVLPVINKFGNTPMHHSPKAASVPDVMPAGTVPDSRQTVLLLAYLAFASVALVIAVAMVAFPGLGRLLVPHYGWAILGIVYGGTLMYAVPPLLKRNPVPVHRYFTAICRMLLIAVGFGIFRTVSGWTEHDFGNPYLVISAWQPIWTVAVPLAWLALFWILRSSTHHRDGSDAEQSRPPEPAVGLNLDIESPPAAQ